MFTTLSCLIFVWRRSYWHTNLSCLKIKYIFMTIQQNVMNLCILPQFIKLNIITNMCYHGNLSVTRLSQSNICFWSNARSFFLVFDKSTMFSIQTLHANLKCKQSNLTQCGRKQSILLYRDGIWELTFYIGNCISVLCSLMSCNVSTCKVSADFVEKSQRYA